MSGRFIRIFLLGLFMLAHPACQGTGGEPSAPGGRRDELKVLTYNLWHGLNPTGVWRFSEYETPAEREKRLQGFYRYARALDPDVMFLEEVNPAPGLTERIARDLCYDYSFEIDNAGVKIGAVGLPLNLRSGLAILAKPDLGYRALGGRKLSGPFGWTGRGSSLQFAEFRKAIAGSIAVNGRRILLLGLHLHHGPEADEEIRAALRRLVDEKRLTENRAAEIIATFNLASARRRGELQNALDLAHRLDPTDGPLILAGDFNASPDAPEMKWLKDELGFRSTTADDDPGGLLMTWDYQRNPNTHFFADFVPVNRFEPAVMRVLQDVIVKQTKRLDYLLYRRFDGLFAVRESGLFAAQPVDGRFCSDHFGIQASFVAIR